MPPKDQLQLYFTTADDIHLELAFESISYSVTHTRNPGSATKLFYIVSNAVP